MKWNKSYRKTKTWFPTFNNCKSRLRLLTRRSRTSSMSSSYLKSLMSWFRTRRSTNTLIFIRWKTQFWKSKRLKSRLSKNKHKLRETYRRLRRTLLSYRSKSQRKKPFSKSLRWKSDRRLKTSESKRSKSTNKWILWQFSRLNSKIKSRVWSLRSKTSRARLKRSIMRYKQSM